MKKYLLIAIGFILISCTTVKAVPTVATPDSLSATQVYNDVKSLYKDDLKDVVKYSVNKADTLISKGYRVLSKGAARTYDILVFQQKVKSFHYLFYWILGLILTVVMFKRIQAYIKNPSESSGILLFFTILVSAAFDIYNSFNFSTMLTGFMNPEYGAIKEILGYI